MQDESTKLTEYISYNGLGRSPMIWGIPFMAGLSVVSSCMLSGMLAGVFLGGAGWLIALTGVPVLLFFKIICSNDDKAINNVLLEAKWVLIKAVGGNAKYYGGTMTIAPTTYGRKYKDVKRYFEKTTGR